MITFLGEYAQTHFSLEEKYMIQYAYPKIDEQRTEHSKFTQDVGDLKNRIQQEGASREIVFATSGNLICWIIQHISRTDREMVEYVLARMATENVANYPVKETSSGVRCLSAASE